MNENDQRNDTTQGHHDLTQNQTEGEKVNVVIPNSDKPKTIIEKVEDEDPKQLIDWALKWFGSGTNKFKEVEWQKVNELDIEKINKVERIIENGTTVKNLRIGPVKRLKIAPSCKL